MTALPFEERTATNRTMSREHLGYRGIVSPTWSFEMKQLLGLAVALLLFGGAVWANIGGGSLFQHTGAWVAHANQ